MDSIIITPKNQKEYQFINELLQKMKLNFKTISDEEKEDLGLAVLMKSADRKKKVSRKTVMNKLQGSK